jgi:hypothetical protein
MNPNFVIVGLPGSGKTTFLAALWHIIESDETDCRLKLDQYEGDLKYLNSIAQAWRTFKKVPRTSQVGDVDVVIQLVDSVTKAKGRGFFPDLAGETFDLQVESRQCSSIFFRNAESDDGILLFINVDSKQDSLSIVELNSMMPPESDLEATKDAPTPINDIDTPNADGLSDQTNRAWEWEPTKIPVQVRIVQILSDLLRPPFTPRRRKIVLILSAWDVVASTVMSPTSWLAGNMPLIDQFLRSNSNLFESRIYGVSAQGVSLDDGEAVGRAAKMTPSHRISIVGQHESGHDITAPLVWLISAAQQ